MIDRKIDKAAIKKFLAAFPATAILGPRQSGKTTLARELKMKMIGSGSR
jgi:uncharacterized protein